MSAPIQVNGVVPIIVGRECTHSCVPSVLVRPLRRFQTLCLLTCRVIMDYRQSRVRIVNCPRRGANFYLDLPALRVALIIVIVTRLMASSPRVKERKVRVRVVVGTMAANEDCVVAPGARRVRTRQASVARGQCVKEQRSTVIEVNTMGSYDRRSRAGLNVEDVIEASSCTRIRPLVLLILINVVRMI